MNRFLWFVVALVGIFFILLAISLEHDSCPEGQVWVMSDAKWICVAKD